MTMEEMEAWWKEQDAKRKETKLQETQAAKDKEQAEEIERRSKAFCLFFPRGLYSAHKDNIKKLIRKAGATKWTGSSWTGDVLVEPIFLKVMLELGKPYDYDGDQLWLTGEIDKFKDLIDFCKSIGASTNQ